jgi:hypothetical protein
VIRLRDEVTKVSAWCTKYALTQGIFKIEGYVNERGRFHCPAMHHQHFSPVEFDLTLEGAKLKAEAMRLKRLASLRKQITNLESMEIKVNE